MMQGCRDQQKVEAYTKLNKEAIKNITKHSDGSELHESLCDRLRSSHNPEQDSSRNLDKCLLPRR